METKIKEAAKKAHYLDDETQALLQSVKKKNNKAVAWFVICWSVLLVVGVGGICIQVAISDQNKKHIDCIVKLFTTPLPSSARSRAIENPSTTCNIRFTS